MTFVDLTRAAGASLVADVARALPMAVLAVERDTGETVFANEEMLTWLGTPLMDGRTVAGLLEPVIARGRQGAVAEDVEAVLVNGRRAVLHVTACTVGPAGLVTLMLVDDTRRRRVERQLAAQSGVSHILSAASTVTDVGPAVLRCLVETLDVDVGALWYVSAGRVLRCVDAWSPPDIEVQPFIDATLGAAVVRGVGLAGRVLAADAPVWIEDFAADAALPRSDAARACGLHFGFAVPARVGGEVFGVLEFLGRRPMARDDGVLDFVEGIASQVGQYFERARAEQDARRERDVIETINLIGRAIASRIELEEVMRLAIDASVELTSAEVGTFVVDEGGVEHRVTAVAPGADAQMEPASRLSVPVVRDLDTIGMIEIGHRRPEAFTDADATFLGGIAAQAAIAIDNGRMLVNARREAEERAHVARVLAASLLPQELPRIAGIDLAVRYQAASAGVCGDFYDVFPLRNRQWGVVVGDVCGRGVEAAALTAMARHTVRAAAMLNRRPSDVLGILNEALLQAGSDRFLTAIVARMERVGPAVRITLASGGHPAPLVLRAAGTVEVVPVAGTLLGVSEDARADDCTVVLAPGDAMVLFTDGLTEARMDDGSLLGESRLQEVASRCCGAPATTIAATLHDAAMSSVADQDDVAILVIAAH